MIDTIRADEEIIKLQKISSTFIYPLNLNLPVILLITT